jgi:hypothetical protein
MRHVRHRKRRLRRHRAADHPSRYGRCREGSLENMASWYQGCVFVTARWYRGEVRERWWGRRLRMRWQHWEEEGWQRTEVGWRGRLRAGVGPVRMTLNCLGRQWVVLKSLRATGSGKVFNATRAGVSHELIPWHQRRNLMVNGGGMRRAPRLAVNESSEKERVGRG